jgi:23S rRNA pseudouridine1911/1915/1917 synthase
VGNVTKTLIGNNYLVRYTVTHAQSGVRLDRFLMPRYKKRSREQIKKAIDSGAITIERLGGRHLNLGKIKPSTPLLKGDIVNVLSTRSKEPEVNFNYQVMFEDDDLIVINKPPNLPVHPAGRYFFNTLLIHLKTRGFTSESNSEKDYYLVHRIDKETSGILLLAKTREACNLLTAQFRNRETDKYYLAIVRGQPQQESFDVTDAIGKRKGAAIGLKMYSVPESEGGLSALTHFEKVETRGAYTLMACFPRTGRQHQIRVHADLAGLPLVGDKLYGMSEEDCLVLLDYHADLRTFVTQEDDSEDSNSNVESHDDDEVIDTPEEEDASPELPKSERYLEIERSLLIPRHALHAAGLRFRHPRTGAEMVFESGLPDDLRAFFEAIDEKPIKTFRTKHW